MTTRLLTIICLFLPRFVSTQTDTVLYWNDNKLFSTHEIVLIENNQTLVECYTFFKGGYFIKSIDTLPQGHFGKLFADSLKKKYIKVQKCDILRINPIRNEGSFWRATYDIEKKTGTKIGVHVSECGMIRDRNVFKQTCHNDYLPWEIQMVNKINSCIDSVYNNKVQRLKHFSDNPSLLTPSFIDAFLVDYNAAEPDARLLSLIMLKKTDAFVNSFNKIPDKNFYWFTLLLDHFPKDINTASLKKTINEHPSKGKRKRKVLKNIKNTED